MIPPDREDGHLVCASGDSNMGSGFPCELLSPGISDPFRNPVPDIHADKRDKQAPVHKKPPEDHGKVPSDVEKRVHDLLPGFYDLLMRVMQELNGWNVLAHLVPVPGYPAFMFQAVEQRCSRPGSHVKDPDKIGFYIFYIPDKLFVIIAFVGIHPQDTGSNDCDLLPVNIFNGLPEVYPQVRVFVHLFKPFTAGGLNSHEDTPAAGPVHQRHQFRIVRKPNGGLASPVKPELPSDHRLH